MINSIQGQQFPQRVQPQQTQPPAPATQEIVNSFEKMIQEVSQDQAVADTKIAETVAGRRKDVVSTMIAMEKADISLRLLMSVRNKMVSAYQEVMRMQV